MRRAVSGAFSLLASFSALAAPEARAVVLTSGIIEIDDALDRSTIDVQYFNLSGPVVNADFLINVVSPGADDNIAAALYGLTAGGDFTPLIDIESGAPGLDSFFLTQSLAAGNYAFVVGLFDLAADEFPPLQVDPNTPSGLTSTEYEISLTGFDAELSFTCRLEGNLDGSQDFTQFVPDAFCPPPPQEVGEPAAAGTLLAGLSGLAGLLLHRRRGGRSPEALAGRPRGHS